jgi:hypothetical protein
MLEKKFTDVFADHQFRASFFFEKFGTRRPHGF